MTMSSDARPAPDSAAQPENSRQFIAKRLRLAGSLIIAGVVVEAFSLAWNHPLSFLAFVCVGGLAIATGIAVYLLALVSPQPR